MNKLFRNAAILAMGFGMAMTFTACHSGEGNLAPDNAKTAVNKLVVKSNVAAKFEFNGVTKTGTSVEFSDLVNNITDGTLKVTEIGGVAVATAGYYAPSYADVDVKFANTNAVTVTYNFVKSLVGTSIPTGSAGTGMVQNTDAGSVVSGSIELPAGSDASVEGSTLAITYYTPQVSEDNTPDGTKKKKSFVSATAEPKNKTIGSGKEFVITANIPGGAGCEIVASNGSSEVAAEADANKIWAKVPNLDSDWTFQLVATGVKKSSGTYTTSKGFLAPNEKEMVGTQYLGYTPAKNIENNELLNMYLASMFGESGTTTVVEGFTNTTGSSIEYIVNQEYTDYEFTSGSVTFTCRVWGKATFVYQTEGEILVHSGGSSL